MIVEGIGGLLVPLLENFYVADMAKRMNLPLIIVSRASLGAINHTLLTVSCAINKGLKIAGIIINNPKETYTDDAAETFPSEIEKCLAQNIGPTNKLTSEFANHSGDPAIPILGIIPYDKEINFNITDFFIEKTNLSTVFLTLCQG